MILNAGFVNIAHIKARMINECKWWDFPFT